MQPHEKNLAMPIVAGLLLLGVFAACWFDCAYLSPPVARTVVQTKKPILPPPGQLDFRIIPVDEVISRPQPEQPAAAPAPAEPVPQQDGIQQITLDEARAMSEGSEFLILLTAEWCQPCHRMKRDLDEVAPCTPVVIIDIDRDPLFRQTRQIPQLWRCTIRGGKIRIERRAIGCFPDQEQLREFLARPLPV